MFFVLKMIGCGQRDTLMNLMEFALKKAENEPSKMQNRTVVQIIGEVYPDFVSD